MKKSIQTIKDKICSYNEVISSNEIERERAFEDLRLAFEKEYPLVSFIGKPYQRHRPKWGKFVPEYKEYNKSFEKELFKNLNYLKNYDILSGADLNLTLETEFFISHNEYAVFVDYEQEFENLNIPTSAKEIYEYLILSL
jgi:hypothetical protein